VSAIAAGYAADALLGDPARLHPVAGFGHIAAAAERATYAPSRARGVAYAAGLVAAAAGATELVARRTRRAPVLAVVLWASLGGRSLVRVGRRIGRLVDANDLAGAREQLPWLCGRNPDELDAAGLRRATVESLAENTADAVVGPLFWGAVAGPAGAAAYRAANTLDAMVGHRSERYVRFGWAAARLDDALNWPVARVTVALTAAGGGAPVATIRTALADGGKHPSPNAGRVEAAFAGALGLRLGGPLAYAGRVEDRPLLGSGVPPGPGDIERAARLSLKVGALAALCAAVVAR
jgi:adenosylcobinamide-phosphate synthase